MGVGGGGKLWGDVRVCIKSLFNWCLAYGNKEQHILFRITQLMSYLATLNELRASCQ